MSTLTPPPVATRRQEFAVTARVRMLIDLAIVMVSTAVIAVLVRLFWPRFGHWGDNAESFLPLWHYFGSELREGRFSLFDHERWAAANLVGEAAYGIFNPVTLLNAVAVSFVDDLSVAAFVMAVEFLAILSAGVYLLARSYGAGRSASMVAAVIVPFAGFTLFYGASNWLSGLMSITWVVHFWWAARAYSIGRIGPGAAMLTGALAATVGNPYAVLGVLVVLFALAVELLVLRRPRRLMGLVVAGAVVGTVVLLVYLPLLGVLDQIDRPAGQFIANNNYLTPSISDLLGLSSPGYLPRMNAWRTTNDLVPSTYLSWIILPLLPWLRWSALRQWRPRLSLFTAAVVFALITLGPDQLWLFRWPIRLVEYLFVAVAIILAIVLSSGIATDHRRRRLVLTGLAVLATVMMAVSANPLAWRFHLAAGAVAAVGVLAAVLLSRRFGTRAVLAAAIIGTAIIAPVQGARFGWHDQTVGPDADLDVAAQVSTVRSASSAFEGSVLQVANIFALPADTTAVTEGQLVFGNLATAAGTTGLNHYTGINFRPFMRTLMIDYRGSVGPSFSLTGLFAPVGGGYDASLVDALGVSTLVISREVRGADVLIDRLPEWRLVDETPDRLVLVRDAPLDATHVTGDGVQARVVDEQGESLRLELSSAQGGSLLIDRLAWNGYAAQIDGVDVPVSVGRAGLIEIAVPAGAQTLALDYQVPNLTLGLLVVGLGAVGGLAHIIVWRRRPDARDRL